MEDTQDGRIMVQLDYVPCINYSMMNSGTPTCHRLIVENHDDHDWQSIEVSIGGELVAADSLHADYLGRGQSLQLNDLTIAPMADTLMGLTEAVNTAFTLSVSADGQQLFSHSYPLKVMAFDQWAGTSVMPELIASFVVPNQPLLSRVQNEAAKFLGRWTGDPSLDEYQTLDRNRVRAQVAAVYEALHGESLVYCAPPASFEAYGQRIRLADRVLTEKMGTCIDTTLLMASCLESIGLHPIIVMMQHHTMVGCWLTPTVPAQMVCDDVSLLLKGAADGNHDMVLVETTALTSADSVPFEKAVEMAMKKIGNESEFLHFVDVHRCRLANVRPLPQRRQDQNGQWVAQNEGIDHSQANDGASTLNHYDLRLDYTAGQQLNKQTIWERKLLDFSLRNNLLNTRLGKRVVPFISFDIDHLEDHLQEGEDYRIMPTPGKKAEPQQNDGMYDSARQATQHQSYVKELIEQGQLVSYLTDSELQNALKYIYRTARTSIEENGANSLFLALGMLRWYETEKSTQPRYAPILLLPVDMVRRAGNNYAIRKRDEGIILNITLVELLKQNFKINIEQLVNLPKDKSGVDVKQIFTYVRRAIMEQRKWNVQEEALLGLFSFSKFVMWNDIHANARLLHDHPVITALMEGGGYQLHSETRIDARQTDKESRPADFAIPMDVDSSQMEAVIESGLGESFILHGPPGTGKSQTITNMIANALYQGKRVLFVAEKMAALSVVQARLTRIGLEPFCLELHSNKVTKRHFLDQMEKALNVAKVNSPKNFERQSEQLFSERKELIAYMEALHRKEAQGLSLYQCISKYLSTPGVETVGQLPPPHRITPEYLDSCHEYVTQMDSVLELTGQPDQHPLYGLEPKTATLETQDQLRLLLDRFDSLFNSLTPQSAELFSRIDSNPGSITLMLRSYVQNGQACRQTVETVSTQYHHTAIDLDTHSLRRELADIQAKWLLPRLWGMRKYTRSLRQYGIRRKADLEPFFTLVEAAQTMQKDVAANNAQAVPYFGALATPGQEKWEAMDAVLEPVEQLTKTLSELNELLSQKLSIEQLQDKARQWHDNLHRMRDWQHWTMLKQKLLTQDMQSVVERIEQGKQTPAQAVNCFVKGVYRMLAERLIDANEELRMFNGLLFQQKIEKYRRDTQLFQELTKKELYCRLAARVPSAATAQTEGSEISILKRNIANGGRGNSIRTIIDNIPTLLPRLCPCMLMSPISVAQFLDMNAEKFDLVIFDEASQMPTSEAVGAIARGKALAVVGDSKQMPPTSFFTSQQTDEEEADVDDMESILEDCKTISMQEYYLSWHYRSKHESLIAFSNAKYYDNRLLTFPSVDDNQRKVSFIKIEGQYDKGRTRSNPQEAQAIVDEVMRRLGEQLANSDERHSMGIVSFSKVQQNLIEDLLTDELDRHPELKDLALGGDETVFIKNLENVQGDERDVILFSVGYGPDKLGRLSMNFGPLNNSGGERRLNVAVSRARYEMMVFSTMTPDMIDLRRSSAKGVEGLKSFLEYAQNGRLTVTGTERPQQESSVITEQICAQLTEHGYRATPHVGRSRFKVDIAVATADEPDRYILGIMLDGRSYYETKTTRDREIVQPSVLHALQWQTMRVYSIDWYENAQKVLDQILKQLDDIHRQAQQPEKTSTKAAKKKPAYQFSIEQLKAEATVEGAVQNEHRRPYIETTMEPVAIDKATYQPYSPINAKVMREILKTEQPITEALLVKRLARLLGFGHSSQNTLRAIELAAHHFYRDPLTFGGMATYWLNEHSARSYDAYRAPSPRAINEVPAVEIMNAVKEVISEEFSLPEDKIPSVTAHKLGFASAGSKIVETIRNVIELMKQQGLVSVSPTGTVH